MVRQRLLDKGLIYATEDYGYVDFTVRRFAEFIARHAPTGPAPSSAMARMYRRSSWVARWMRTS